MTARTPQTVPPLTYAPAHPLVHHHPQRSLPDDTKVSQPVLYRGRRSDDLETDDYWDDVDPLTDHIAGTTAASVPSVAGVPATDEIATDSKLTWKNIVGASRPPMW